MLRAAAAFGLATAALASGCGGSDFDPEGRPVGATLEVVGDPFPLGGRETPLPQPFAVRFGERAWREVVSAIPSPLPRPLDQGEECLSGLKVTVRLSSGEEVEYGPCQRPAEIEPLRRIMHRMLRRAEAS